MKTKAGELVLKGTTAYYENLVPEVANRLKRNELVFLHDILPGNCQYNCLKCFSKSSDTYFCQLKERGLPLTRMDKSVKSRLIHEAYENGVRSVVIAGAGEPLISPELNNVITICSDLRGLSLIVFTNGLLLDGKKAEECFSKGVSVVLSIDSISTENYDKLTRTSGNFNRVLKNLESALDLSDKYSIIHNGYKAVPLAVNTNPTILTYNPSKNEVEGIHGLVSGRAAHFVSHPTANGNALLFWKQLVGNDDFSQNPALKEAEKRYAAGLGGSSRRKDGKCAYIHNGVVQFDGYWMVCPNAGIIANFGRYPEVGIEQHFSAKRRFLNEKNNPSCITRDCLDLL